MVEGWPIQGPFWYYDKYLIEKIIIKLNILKIFSNLLLLILFNRNARQFFTKIKVARKQRTRAEERGDGHNAISERAKLANASRMTRKNRRKLQREG